MAALKPDVAALVASMPDADNPGRESKFTGPEPAEAEKVFLEILGGGREALGELLGLLKESTDPEFKSYKAEYVLHGIVVFVARPEHDAHQRLVNDVLAQAVASGEHSKWKTGLLIRELQAGGDGSCAEAIGKHLLDSELCECAAQALIAIGRGPGRDPALRELRKAAGGAAGGARLTLVQALGVLADEESTVVLQEALKDDDPQMRRTAAWALANVGAVSAVSDVIREADSAKGWERIGASKACLLLAERLASKGQKGEAIRIYTHLRETRTGTEDAYLVIAAERGLAIVAALMDDGSF